MADESRDEFAGYEMDDVWKEIADEVSSAVASSWYKRLGGVALSFLRAF
jgi:hypothetical protein